MKLEEFAKVKIKKEYLLDYVNNTPLAITEKKLEAIHDVLYNHYNDKIIDLAVLEASLGKKLNNVFEIENRDGNAIIPIEGVISKKMNLLHNISGGTSTELVQKGIEIALSDSDIHHIILKVDSPGGSVSGVKELNDYIYDNRGKKPITTFIDSEGASGGYWIGSAADRIVAYDTSIVGSIGVVSAHYDFSKQMEMDGIKKTYIYAGKYKRIANDAEPLSEEGRDYLQSLVDSYYTIFVESVARNRGVSVEKVLNDMADGRLFIGKEALKMGLIDRIGSFDSVLIKKGVVSGGSATVVINESSNSQTYNSGNYTQDTPNSTNIEPKVIDENIINREVINHLQEHRNDLGLDKQDKSQTKEVIDVNSVDELKEKYPEIYKASIQSYEDKVKTLEEDNKKLSLKVLTMEHKEKTVLANTIMENCLSESSIPKTLHSKVKALQKWESFDKEDNPFVAGNESVKLFTEKFKKEVDEWEKSLSVNSNIGIADGKKDDTTDSDSDTEYGRKLAKTVSGKIRSDK